MRTNKLFIGILIVFIVVITLLAFKIGSKNQSKQESTLTQPQNTPTQNVAVGQTAPDFSLTTLDKETFRLSDKKGKIIILFGMAGWCETCIPEGKALTKIRQEYTDKGIEIIGVAFTQGDNNDFLKQYKQIGGIDIPLAPDTDKVAQKYNLTRLETTYIINKNGTIVYKDERTTSYEEYKQELDKLL